MYSSRTNMSLKFDMTFDREKLSQDLAHCLAANWILHFNSKDYSGSWTVIALRSQTGSYSDIVATVADKMFKDTNLLGECSYFSEILAGFAFEIESVRLMRLAPGSVINAHSDLGLAYRYGCFRLHIPITTDADVQFIVGDERVPMQAGECWYADFDLPHSVANLSDKERVHLVIDGKRNAWSDDFFRSAGYDFEKEQQALAPNYDLPTMEGMLREFEQMDASVVLPFIADLKEKIEIFKAAEKSADTSGLKARWIPAQLLRDHPLRIREIFAGTRRFTEPFFDETLAACRALPENDEARECSFEQFIAQADAADSPEPSAFIFHVSRCGSTLLTQMLNENPRCITLAEVPLLDALLRLSEQDYGLEAGMAARLFKAAVRLLTRRVSGDETHVFIKCDSWHNLFIDKLRAMYPSVPFVLLYRTPEEVLRSQMKLPGMQAIPGAVNPAIFGFALHDVAMQSREMYFSNVLQLYFERYKRAIEQDANTFLFSYHEGAESLLKRIADMSGLPVDEAMQEKAKARTRFHSKMPALVFNEDAAPLEMSDSLNVSLHIFQDLEARRLEFAMRASSSQSHVSEMPCGNLV